MFISNNGFKEYTLKTHTCNLLHDDSSLLGCDWVGSPGISNAHSAVNLQVFYEVLYHEDEGTIIFSNIVNSSPNNTASHLRRLKSSAILL
jgi:hypothetical protein